MVRTNRAPTHQPSTRSPCPSREAARGSAAAGSDAPLDEERHLVLPVPIKAMAFCGEARLCIAHENEYVVGDPSTSEFNQANRETSELEKVLSAPLTDLELSVRARNCLDGANLRTLHDLVRLSENEVINLKNLGKTSLTEIKNKLAERGLSLGMTT